MILLDKRGACSLATALWLFSWLIPAQAGDQVRALLVAKTEATLSSQLQDRISEIKVEEGDAFKQGQVLLSFHCGIVWAELAKAKADVTGATKTLESNRKLRKLGSSSALELAVAEAELAKAKAELSAARTRAGYCSIKAPFSGRVAQLHVEAHESVKTGQELMDLLDDKQLELELFAPSPWLSWLRAGTRFEVLIEETGKTYPAEVIRIGARVDPVSRSIALRGRITTNPTELLAGMSGSARFEIPAGPQ